MFLQPHITSRTLPTPSQLTAQVPSSVAPTSNYPRVSTELDKMRKKMQAIQTQIHELKASAQALLPLAKIIKLNNAKLEFLQESVSLLTDGLNPLIDTLRQVALLSPIVPKLLNSHNFSLAYSQVPGAASPPIVSNGNPAFTDDHFDSSNLNHG